MKHETIAPPLRRHQVLAFIIEQLVRHRISPTSGEIAQHFGFSEGRAKQIEKQLIERGNVERTPGAKRGLRVRDTEENRHQLHEAMRALGWITAEPMGRLETYPNRQLPLVAVIEHVPDDITGVLHGLADGA